jgi:hypothetical protein
VAANDVRLDLHGSFEEKDLPFRQVPRPSRILEDHGTVPDRVLVVALDARPGNDNEWE